MLAVRDGSPDRIEIWMFVQDHNHPRVQHICGRECLQKVLNRRLDSWERPGAAKPQEVPLEECRNIDCPIGCPDSHCLPFGDDDDTPKRLTIVELERETRPELQKLIDSGDLAF
jgi:hypothetical protein